MYLTVGRKNAKVYPQMIKEGTMKRGGQAPKTPYHYTVFRLYEACIAKRDRDILVARQGQLKGFKRRKEPVVNPKDPKIPPPPGAFSPTSPVVIAGGPNPPISKLGRPYWSPTTPNPKVSLFMVMRYNTYFMSCVCEKLLEDEVSLSCLENTYNRCHSKSMILILTLGLK